MSSWASSATWPASVLLLFTPSDAAAMCGFLGVESGTEIGDSALMEIGNIMGASYLNALGQMTGMQLEPTPPAAATDMLGAIVQTVLAERAGAGDIALLLDSDLVVEDSDASVSFLLVPDQGGVEQLLASVGPVAMAETMVRMGELAASAVAGDVLVSLGLGSCIGLALVDRRHGVAGLAHVVLPDERRERRAGHVQVRRSCRPRAHRSRRWPPVRGVRIWTPCSSGVLRCSPCPPPLSKSASATRPPCATSSTPRTSA